MHTTIDPATIVLALALGATVQGQPNCPPPIQDAYRALKTSLADAYPAVHCALLEDHPNRQSVRTLVAEDIEETQAHQDDTILLHASAVLFAVYHHSPQHAQACGVSIRNTNTDGSLVVKDITSSGAGVLIHESYARQDLHIAGVRAGQVASSSIGPDQAAVQIKDSSVGRDAAIYTGPSYHFYTSGPPAVPPHPELVDMDAAIRRHTGVARVELKLDRSFVDYSDEDKKRLLVALEQLLHLDGEIHIVGLHEGSTLVILEIPDAAVDALADLVRLGALADFGVKDIRRVYNLSGFQITGMDLRKAHLEAANLRRVGLSRAGLSGANLNSVDLSEADLSRADLSGADLSGADLSAADLMFTDLSGATLQKACLNAADLRVANLSSTNISAAQLHFADLGSANLSGANLTEANLSGADLSGADLSGADFHLARYDGETRWPEDFDYRHSGAIGPQADLSDADLSRADLSAANLTGANISGANLTGANLTGANLTDASLIRADVSGANLTGADLRNADLTFITYDEHTIWPADFDRFRVHDPVREW